MRRTSSSSEATERVSALLLDVARGDCGAFEELYTVMAERVLYFIQQRLRDRAQSEEVAQEVFLEVWQQARRFDPEKGVAATWILTMAGRRAIDRVRAAQSTRDRELAIAPGYQDAPHDQVVETIELRDTRDAIHLALARISPLQRQAVTLARLEGYTIAETAKLVGASESAVKTRVRDGVRAMREVLDEHVSDAAA